MELQLLQKKILHHLELEINEATHTMDLREGYCSPFVKRVTSAICPPHKVWAPVGCTGYMVCGEN